MFKAIAELAAACARLAFWIAVSVILWRVAFSAAPYDSTDPPGGHSGMTLFVDHETGCEYLGFIGPDVPRMGPDGKQICSFGDNGDFNSASRLTRLLDDLVTDAIKSDAGVEVYNA